MENPLNSKITDFIEYTSYIHSSELLYNYYLSQKYYCIADYECILQKWINQESEFEQNKPLVLQSEVGEGKKLFLVNWMKKKIEEDKKNQNYYLIEFCSFINNYAQVISKTLIHLRQLLNISQKIQLTQQKLRKYFTFWLQLCSSHIYKQSIHQGRSQNRKIIIILQGIDQVLNKSGNEMLPSFWIPLKLPKNIKLILTCAKNSNCSINLKQKNIPRIDFVLSNECRKQIIKIYNKKIKTVSQKNFKIMRYGPQINQLSEQLDSSILIKRLIEKWQEINPIIIKKLLIVLTLSSKGLTQQEISKLLQIKNFNLKNLPKTLQNIIFKFNHIFIIIDKKVKQIITQLYLLQNKQNNLIYYHTQIASVVRQSSNSIHKLQTLTYHLFHSKNYLELKQILSQIQNFLFLFNSYTKYQLCHYWIFLELKQNFDPVFQYNKAIQGFQMHYHPPQKDIFRIILQISRFFRQYGDFQVYNTPKLRHPLIKGQYLELQQLTVYQQLENMKMLIPKQLKQKKSKQKQSIQKEKQVSIKISELIRKSIDHKIDFLLKQIVSRKEFKINEYKKSKDNYKIYTYKNEAKSDIQTINIQIPSNQLKFKTHYLDKLKPYFQYNSILNQNDHKLQSQNLESNLHFHKDKKKYQYIPLNEFQKEQFNIQIPPPQFYCYKQWIWMQFPWISLNVDEDYSKEIKKCIKSATEYISVNEQKLLTIEALKIAILAKKKKQLILEKRPIQISMVNQKILKLKREKSADFKTSRKQNIQLKQNFKSSKNLLKQLQKYEYLVHEKSKSNRNSTFLTQSIGANILPCITKRTNIRINIEQHKEDTLLKLKKQYDSLIFENRRLVKIYQQKKLIENQKQYNLKKIQQEFSERIKIYEKKINQIKYKYARNLILQERLKIILDICQANKIHNTYCIQPLILFSQNLKHMIDNQQKLKNSNYQQIKLLQKQHRQAVEQIEKLKNIKQQIVEIKLAQKNSIKGFRQQKKPQKTRQVQKKQTYNDQQILHQINQYEKVFGKEQEFFCNVQKYIEQSLLKEKLSFRIYQLESFLQQLRQTDIKSQSIVKKINDTKQCQATKQKQISYSKIEEYTKILNKRLTIQIFLQQIKSKF